MPGLPQAAFHTRGGIVAQGSGEVVTWFEAGSSFQRPKVTKSGKMACVPNSLVIFRFVGHETRVEKGLGFRLFGQFSRHTLRPQSFSMLLRPKYVPCRYLECPKP